LIRTIPAIKTFSGKIISEQCFLAKIIGD